MRGRVLVVVALVVLVGAGCSSTSTSVSPRPPERRFRPVPTRRRSPRWSARRKPRTDIDSALGETATVSDPDLGRPSLLLPLRLSDRVVRAVDQGALELGADRRLLPELGHQMGKARDLQDSVRARSRPPTVGGRAQGLEGPAGRHLRISPPNSACRRPAPATWPSPWATSSWGAGRGTDRGRGLTATRAPTIRVTFRTGPRRLAARC